MTGVPALGAFNATINSPGFADRRQKLLRRLGDHRPGYLQRPVQAGKRQPADKILVPGDETRHGLGRRLDTDPIGHVEREKVARLEEPIDGFQADVVGIDEIRPRPSPGLHGRIRLGPHVRRAAAHDRVFAVRFVPNRGDFDALPAARITASNWAKP